MRLRNRPALAVALAASAAATALCAMPAAAQAQNRVQAFNIPAEAGDRALNDFAAQAAVQIVFPYDAAHARQAPALRGRFTRAQAANTLASALGLVVSSDQSGVVTLAVPDAAGGGGPAPQSRGARIDPERAPSVEEVVVTAQKREQRLIDVPASVAVLNGQSLIGRNAVHLSDYLQGVPGVSIDALGDGRTQIVMRGLTAGQGINPTVGITIDDAPFGATTWSGLGDSLRPDLDPFDISQIEVLKGPQGTLYGASSLGGLIKYDTIKPSMAGFSGRMEADTSATQDGGVGYGLRGAVNVPVSATFAVRASGFYKRDGGFIDDSEQNRTDVNTAHSYGGRFAAALKLGEAVTIDASALLQNNYVDASTTEDVLFDRSPAYGDLTHRRAPGTDFFDSRIRFYDLSAAADLGSVTLRSITSYSQNAYSGVGDMTPSYGRFVADFYPATPDANVSMGNDVTTKKWTEEVRLQSNGAHVVDWMVGFFYQHEDNSISQPAFVIDPATGAPLNVEQFLSDVATQSLREYAGFANATWHVDDRLDLQAGVRESHNDQTYLEIADGPLNGGLSVANAKSSESAFTYLATARYKITPDASVYARLTSGYRPGGPNSVAPTLAPATYKPDFTHNYELGFKGQTPDGRLTVEAAAFLTDWDQVQIRVIDAANGFSYFDNATSARSTGAEGTLTWRPLPATTMTGNVAYTDAKLTGALPMGSFGNPGDPLPYTAKWTAGIDLQQGFDVTANVRGLFDIGLDYTGPRMADFTSKPTIPRFDLGSYTTLNTRLALSRDNWTLNFFLNNLTNERGLLSAQFIDSIGKIPPYAAGVLTPRTGGVSLTATF